MTIHPRVLGEQGLLGVCTQSNINADTNATGEERDRINIDTIRRDQNNTDTTDGITDVRDFRDILPFHDRFLQRLGDRHRWFLYRVRFSQSPDQQFDTVCNRTWTKDYVLHEIERLD
jgi:hypothetical protein